MDHREVNDRFVTDLLAVARKPSTVLDVGTGTAQIPIELCRRVEETQVVAVDLAGHMLTVAADNVRRAGLADRIRLEASDAKSLPYPDAHFDMVMSNSIVHHIPQPRPVLAELVRVCRRSGAIFVRDLLRPADDASVQRLVDTHAAGTNAHQRQMFDDSLRAALTLDEIRDMIVSLGFPPDTVRATSDRHWTWAARL
jgi:ubiquinone/menaquinone biosynthesis C-methylase UbiE